MRKLFLFVAMFVAMCSVNAEIHVLPYVGTGGYIDFMKDGSEVSKPAGVGFQTGVQAEIGLGNSGFTINPGIAYTGYLTEIMSISFDGGYGSSNNLCLNETKHNLEIPVIFNYYFRPEQTGYFLGVGPKLNIFLGGKQKITANGRSASEKLDMDRYSPIGLTLGFNTGYQFPFGLRLAGVIDYRLTNLYSKKIADAYKDAGISAHYTCLFIGAQVGWKF